RIIGLMISIIVILEVVLSVNIFSVASFVVVSPHVVNLNVGQTFQLSATVSSSVSSAGLYWSSSDNSICSVSSTGKVTAKKQGIVTITVALDIPYMGGNSYEDTCDIYVTKLPKTNAQNKNCWCWAASAKLVGAHNGGGSDLRTGAELLDYPGGVISDNCGYTPTLSPTADAGQRQIVIQNYSSDHNFSGSSSNILNGMSLTSSHYRVGGVVGDYGLTSDQISSMLNELSSGRWVVAATNRTDGTNSGHAIVLKGYDSITDKVYFYDPYCDSESFFSVSQISNNNIYVLGFDSGNRPRYIMYYVFWRENS
ncbi:MAG: Ig-like domain-containing protein, partial [Firmicutes bacterium]|nr:Ig-like domain-containing protein [Candidatus Colimorpha enterica]